MVWSGVLLLMLHFVSDFEKVLSHKVHLESTWIPHRVYVESRWSPPQPVGECHLQWWCYESYCWRVVGRSWSLNVIIVARQFGFSLCAAPPRSLIYERFVIIVFCTWPAQCHFWILFWVHIQVAVTHSISYEIPPKYLNGISNMCTWFLHNCDA